MKTLNKKQAAAEAKALAALPTTSARIRHLDSKGYTRSQIAKILDKRYQHVRNVLITPIAKPKS